MTTDPTADQTALAPSVSQVSLALLMRTTEANLLGNVHGGEIMKLADTTAGAVAFRHCKGPAVTAAMDEMVFLTPVHVGDILHANAQANWVGKSSMEIGVRLDAEPYSEPGLLRHVASAYLVFVALDEAGEPRAIPSLRPETPDEVRRWREAEIRRAHRLARKQEIDRGRESAG